MMNGQEEISKNELAKRFSQFEKVRAPKGFISICDDIDIDVYEYESEIAGLITTYLKNAADIDPATINLGEDLDQKLNECEAKLRELITYKNTISELAKLLKECLQAESKNNLTAS